MTITEYIVPLKKVVTSNKFQLVLLLLLDVLKAVSGECDLLKSNQSTL